MSGLKFIMNVDDDQPGETSRRDDGIPPPAASVSQIQSRPAAQPSPSGRAPSSAAQPLDHRNHASTPSLLPLGPSRPNPPQHPHPSERLATALSQPLAAPSPSPRPSLRRRSTASNDSMDQTVYAAGPSAPRGGGGAQHPSNLPIRPMPNSSGPDIPLRLTPITRRVSRAKKGVPVHTCEICRPPKTFTRAEHLRRHQLSHQNPAYPCTYPGCERAFHRPDLLARHQQRHEQDAEKALQGGGGPGSGRGLSLDDGLPSLYLPSHSNSPSPGLPSTSVHPAGSSGFHPPFRATDRPTGVSQLPNQGEMGGAPYPHMPPGSYEQQRTAAPPVLDPGQNHPLPTLHLPSSGHPPEPGPPDASPWASSTSDSPYSTPASDPPRHPPYWVPSRQQSPGAPPDWPPPSQLLTPYGNQPSSRDMSRPGPSLLASRSDAQHSLFVPDYATSSSPYTAPSSNQTFGAFYDEHASSGFEPADADAERQAAHMGDAAPATHYHHQTGRGGHPGPDPSMLHAPRPRVLPSRGSDVLVAPMAALSDRAGTLAGLHYGKQLAAGVSAADEPRGFDESDEYGAAGIGSLGVLSRADGPSAATAGPETDDVGVLALDLSLSDCRMEGPEVVLPGPQPLPRQTRASMALYVEVYWSRFHPLYPVVHRATFGSSAEEVLRCAMAAVGTQYLDDAEHRRRGNQLHEYAWQEIKRILQWDIQVMQAILLCELFARFRGRKAATKPSKPFASLCSRVFEDDSSLLGARFARSEGIGTEARWRMWVEVESRRRLRTACFVVDVHTSLYQQQRRAQEYTPKGGGGPLVPLSHGSRHLWEAPSAEAWIAILARDPRAGDPTFPPRPESLVPEDVTARPLFDRAALLAVAFLRLPPRRAPRSRASPAPPAPASDDEGRSGNERCGGGGGTHSAGSAAARSPSPSPAAAEDRIVHLFSSCPRANTYLALHHTPLHDLLAVSGDSWLFSQKVLPAASFVEHQRRLQAWVYAVDDDHGGPSRRAAAGSMRSRGSRRSGGRLQPTAGRDEGMSITCATTYAARGILGFLALVPGRDEDVARPGTREPASNKKRKAGSSRRGSDESGGASASAGARGEGNPASAAGSAHADADADAGASTGRMPDISDYWGAYVCALICWAFGQGAGRQGSDRGRSGRPSPARSPPPARGLRAGEETRGGGGGGGGGGGDGDEEKEEEAAIGWLEAVAWARAAGETRRARGRREAALVVGLVRRRLERDCLGGRSRLFVDAVGVLRKLEERTDWKWF